MRLTCERVLVDDEIRIGTAADVQNVLIGGVDILSSFERDPIERGRFL